MIALLLSLVLSAPQVNRNALVIILDDVARADLEEVSALGGTPNLDALAAQGVTFTRCMASSVCSPSRRAIVFGRYYAFDAGVCGPANWYTPGFSQTSLAEVVPTYASAIIGKWHIGGDAVGGAWQCAPISQGFNYWVAGHENLRACSNISYTNWERVDACDSAFTVEYEPFAVRDAFVAGWPATVGPKLGIVASSLAHGPHHKPPASLLPPGYPAPGNVPRDQYRAMIAAYDTLIGEMLAVVDLRYTMVFVVGDNGTPTTFEPRGKATCYERGINVPLIVAGWTVRNPGRVTDELVHVADIPATIAAQFASTLVQEWDGASLHMTLADLPHAPHHNIVIGGSGAGPGGLYARSWRVKLIDRDPPLQDELYDLVGDGYSETVNRVGENSYAADELELRAALDAFRARTY